MRNLFFAIAIAAVIILCNACSSPDGNYGGTEYMPDMYHSIAYEANLEDYYYYNTWDSEQAYYKIAKPRKPVNGTIPRGYAGAGKAKHMNGTASLSAMVIPMNGSVPYYYADTEEARAQATANLINNPFPITAAGLESSKELYETFCGICHGNKGDGNGYLVDEANLNAVYPAQPANFLTDEFVAASNGRYYHAIMHGKNVMGGYADKLSYEERWNVIHYIRSLQAKDKKLVYNEKENTLNSIDMPGASSQYMAMQASRSNYIDDGVHHDAEGHDMHHESGAHNSDHGHGHAHDADHGMEDGHGHDGDHDHGTVEKEKKGLLKKIKEKVGDKVEDIKVKKAAKKAAKDKKGH